MGKLSKYFSKKVRKVIDGLNTPEKIQKFIDTKITYDPIREDRSVSQVVEDGMGECYNGALFATACLLNAGIESSVIELLAKDDEEHILCVYKKNGCWGSIAQSKFLGLKGRNPIYLNIRDLAVSYREFYFTLEDGRYSLASFTNPVNLKKYNYKWLTDSATVIKMGKDIRKSKHFTLMNGLTEKFFTTPERYWKEVKYIPKGTVISKHLLSKRP